MKYYIIKQNDKLSGVPIFLNAVLSEKYDKTNPMPPMRYDWFRKTYKGRKIPFPSEAYLISKNKLLKSDYLSNFGGFIISKEMLDLIELSKSKPFDKIKLKTLGWKGKNITDKEYYFIDYLFSDRLENIDYEKSLFAWDTSELKYDRRTIENIMEEEYPKYIKGFKELILKEVPYDVFQLRNSKVSNFLICNEQFKNKVLEKKIYGVNFIELPILGTLYEGNYNYGNIKWNR